MSLEDESFPHDSLLALDLSPAPLGKFPFPRRSLEQQREHSFSGDSNKSALLLAHNVSASSSIGNQTISSAESVNGQLPLAKIGEGMPVDERMVKSDQTGASSTTATALADPQSFSFNNIHSEYTKRRYKHIESKVGQYIANIRNEDERRKRKLAQFQRHNSLPEIPVSETQVKKTMGLQRSATIVAEHLNRALVGVIDNVDENDEEADDDGDDADVEVRNSTATTSGTISTHGSSSGRGSAVTDEHQPESDESAEGVGSVDGKVDAMSCIDTKTLSLLLDERDRLQSYIDYQQTKLDEKQGEITRLRKNVDFLRVRLSNTEDQLKRNSSGRSMTLTSSGTHGSIFGAGYGQTSVGNWGAGRQSLQGLLYCVAKTTQATQTEMLQLTPTPVHPPTPPPPPPPSPLPLDLGLPRKEAPLLYVTPDTPDANSNGGADDAVEAGARNMKTVATIQPMSLNFSNYLDGESAERRTTKDCATLRRRSNSLASRQQQQKRAHANSAAARSDKSDHISRSSHPSSSDSAIDVEVIDLSTSPKPSRRKRYTIERSAFGIYAPKAPRNFAYNRDQPSPSPMGLYIAHCPNSTALDISTLDAAQSARQLLAKPITTGGRGAERRVGKRSLSRRWLHLFGSCIRCTNSQRAENEQFALQQTYTQMPLLESTFERSCVELRSQ